MSSVGSRVHRLASSGALGRFAPTGSLAFIAAAVLASLATARLVGHGRAKLALAAIVAIPAGLFLLARPVRGLLLGVAVIVLVPFTYSLGPAQASVPRVATLAAVLAIALGAKEAHERVRLCLVDLAAIAFVVMGILSWQLGTHPPTSLRSAANFLTPIAFYPAARRFGGRYAQRIFWALLAAGAVASLTLYYEFIFSHAPLFVDTTSYYWNAGGGFVFRPGGVFGSPPAAATVLAMTALCGLPLVSGSAGRRRLAAAACVAVSIGAMLLTFTRGPIIGFCVGVLVYIVLLRPAAWGRLLFGSAVVALVLVFFVLPRVAGAAWYEAGVLRQGTFSERQSYWASSWPLITNSREHLLLGHGINSLIIGGPQLPGPIDPDIATVPELSNGGPHSQYVRTLLEEGLVGLALLLAWVLGSVAVGARAAWRAAGERPLLAAATGATLSFAVTSIVDDTLRDPPIFAVVAVITGLIVSRSRPDGYVEGAQS
jgi:O-antigen ligase